MAGDDDRLHSEVDRQLGEVRAACDGLATKSGLLIAALALGASVTTPKIDKTYHATLLVVTLLFVGIAALGALVTLMPWLKIGPEASALSGWAGRRQGSASRSLYDSKIVLLEANLKRLLVVRIFFTIQTATTMTAIAIALVYSAWKWVVTERNQGERSPSASRHRDEDREPSESEQLPERDHQYYAEIRQAVGRGAPTLLVGTSRRALDRSVEDLRIDNSTSDSDIELFARAKLTGPERLIKEIFDRLVALAALVLLAPFLLVIACAIRISDGGPVLFTQVRVGKDGREFRMYKFRTMVVDAEKRRAELMALNDRDGILFKIRRDPRVTPMGARLRRWSLDELPQLFNVLRGDMSLVGPRPLLPGDVATYAEHGPRRFIVKPGITGLWQVSGRQDLSWDESVRLDLRYVDNWSFILDLQILWKTCRAVLGHHGAY